MTEKSKERVKRVRKKIKQLIGQNTEKNGTILNLSFEELEDAGMETLSEGLKNTSLKEIRLYSNKLTDKSAPFIAKIIQNNKDLETLDLGLNDLKDAGMETLSEGLKNTSLKKINLYSNDLTSKSAPFIITLIKNNPNLETLNLRVNRLTRKDSQDILSYLNKYDKSIPLIKGLDLDEEGKKIFKKIYKQ